MDAFSGFNTQTETCPSPRQTLLLRLEGGWGSAVASLGTELPQFWPPQYPGPSLGVLGLYLTRDWARGKMKM